MIFDKGQPAKSLVNLQLGSEIPVRLGLLLDTSTSASNSPLSREAIVKSTPFVLSMLINPADKAFILRFADSAQATGFMNRDQFFKFNLDYKPGAGTALYDSIVLACAERMMMTDPSELAHLALVVISDGNDNGSHFSFDKAVAVAQEAGVVIFTISVDPSPMTSRGMRVLKALAEETGGESFRPDRREIPKVFQTIEQQIENTYVAIYAPADDRHDNRFRKLEVKISDKKLRARAPKGYFSRATTP